MGRPSALRNETLAVSMCACRTASRIPIRDAASTAVPRTSMGYPPSLKDEDFSTIVTSKPYRSSQYPKLGPAMLAPEISTLRPAPFVMDGRFGLFSSLRSSLAVLPLAEFLYGRET